MNAQLQGQIVWAPSFAVVLANLDQVVRRLRSAEEGMASEDAAVREAPLQPRSCPSSRRTCAGCDPVRDG